MNIVNRLTLRQLKENKRRTLVTIIGVIISVAMIMGVITIFTSFSELMKQREIYSDGYWHVKYKNVTKGQIDKIKKDDNTDKVILSRDLGYSVLKESKNNNKPYLFIREFNKEGFENYPVKLIEGRLPKSSNEVVISSHIDTNSKVKYNIGDRLNLDIGNRYAVYDEGKSSEGVLGQRDSYSPRNGGKEEVVPTLKKEYKVVGVIERPSFEVKWAPGYTVLSYVDEKAIENEKIDALVSLKKINKDIFEKYKNFAKENGIEKAEFNIGLLKWYGVIEAGEVRAGLYGIVAVLIAVIMIGSISLIYNAFAISVSERSKHLGMLSSVGATKRQKRNSVLFEAGFIGLISIPIGIIAGIAGIWVTFIFVNPILKETMSVEIDLALSVSLVGTLLAVVISIVTIYISAYIPAVRASRTTPIEAIRQTKDIKLTNKNVKTSKLTRKIFGIEAEIGLKNLKRNKRRYIATIFSMVVSIVLFLTVSTFGLYMTKSIDLTSKNFNYDISIGSGGGTEESKINIFNKFTSLEGVKEYSITKQLDFKTFLEKDKALSNIELQGSVNVNNKKEMIVVLNSLNKEAFNRYAKEVGVDAQGLNSIENPSAIVINKVNYVSSKGKYIEEKAIKAKEGEKIRLYERDKEDKINKIADIKIAKITDKLPIGNIYQGTENVFNVVVSEDVLSSIAGNSVYKENSKLNIASSSNLFIKTDDPLKLQEKINEVSKGLNETTYIYNIEEQAKSMKQSQMLFSIFIYGFIALITAISVANIFNTISTSIALRKKEFAMLKSVGMTPKGFNKMINYESIFYGIKSLSLGLPLGFIVMIILYKALSQGFEFGFTIPWFSVGIVIVAVFTIVGLAMIYSSSKIKKENIIDALKQENI